MYIFSSKIVADQFTDMDTLTRVVYKDNTLMIPCWFAALLYPLLSTRFLLFHYSLSLLYLKLPWLMPEIFKITKFIHQALLPRNLAAYFYSTETNLYRFILSLSFVSFLFLQKSQKSNKKFRKRHNSQSLKRIF